MKISWKWFMTTLVCYAVFSALLAAKVWNLGQELGCVRAVMFQTGGKTDIPEALDWCRDIKKQSGQ